MRTIDVFELEDLEIPDTESADRISAALGSRRDNSENLHLTATVLVWDGGRQKGKPTLAILEFTNTELFRRFGLLWHWEQRFLVSAILKKLGYPDETVLDRRIEVGIPWSGKNRRRISVNMTGAQRIGEDTDPRFGYILSVGLV